jgi:hypothetical protein
MTTHLLSNISELGDRVVGARDRVARLLVAGGSLMTPEEIKEQLTLLCLLAGQSGVSIGIEVCRDAAKERLRGV